MWDPPRPGLEPVSPALAGRLSTTAPPGKPKVFLNCSQGLCVSMTLEEGRWGGLRVGDGKNTLFSGQCSSCCRQCDDRDHVDPGVLTCSKETARLKSPLKTTPPHPRGKGKAQRTGKKSKNLHAYYVIWPLCYPLEGILLNSHFSDEEIEVQRSRCYTATHSHPFHVRCPISCPCDVTMAGQWEWSGSKGEHFV